MHTDAGAAESRLNLNYVRGALLISGKIKDATQRDSHDAGQTMTLHGAQMKNWMVSDSICGLDADGHETGSRRPQGQVEKAGSDTQSLVFKSD